MFVKQVSEPLKNPEVFADVMEDVFTCVPGAYEYDVLSDEQIDDLHRRTVEIKDESGDKIAEVEIRCYLVDDEYTVEVELLDGKPSALFTVYTAQEAAEKWGLAEVTVRQWIHRGKFRVNEVRKSAGTWLVAHGGMVRIAGEPEK